MCISPQQIQMLQIVISCMGVGLLDVRPVSCFRLPLLDYFPCENRAQFVHQIIILRGFEFRLIDINFTMACVLQRIRFVGTRRSQLTYIPGQDCVSCSSLTRSIVPRIGQRTHGCTRWTCSNFISMLGRPSWCAATRRNVARGAVDEPRKRKSCLR